MQYLYISVVYSFNFGISESSVGIFVLQGEISEIRTRCAYMDIGFALRYSYRNNRVIDMSNLPVNVRTIFL